MNVLPRDKQIAILHALVEGNSVRSTSRMTGAHVATILNLLVKTGKECDGIHDRMMRHLDCSQIQVDEIWSFVGCKQRHLPPGEKSERGDAYTFVALDRDTKLVPAYWVGKRDGWNAQTFMLDLAERLAPDMRPQISSDAFDSYPWAIESAFGSAVDYGQILKKYGSEDAGRGRYSPPKVTEVDKTIVSGAPDEEMICTSHVERQNLTMRMAMRRFTRLTNAFSKKLENLKAAVSLHFAYYNFVRVHQSLRITPAMAAGVTDRVWSLDELIAGAS